ncbi:hypothetical protein [Methanosphaerula palustris]|uniref:Uncharacterized protein n=1 Tax=Methanosphaerula palustris (strain ATCC BAA-1556 / DSM 19958 / E1-9c) TaxID=521011 RepID=B8GHW8_METPE|nr:hypothetical protein [Methanosphaerula palustris]ACL16708.1 hypothetical protein Mpal_1377 [Methanosphaerula palustris E1-9c]
MATNHNNEPRDASYSKEQFEYYTDKEGGWLNKGSKSIFAGKYQKDLFIFAMAIGKYRDKKSLVKSPKLANVRVDAMTERQKWALLSIGISESQNLLCLKDESSMYANAEEYANEGLKILISHIEKYGINYPKSLEADLKDILEEKT